MKKFLEDNITAGFCPAVVLALDFHPDDDYLLELKDFAEADEAYVRGGNVVIIEWHEEDGFKKAKQFCKVNELI